MKKKELEILLQKIPSFEKPVPRFEQYLTPADIAADIIFTAHQFGDIENKTVIDLGCGTGIFSTGAALTGAGKVIGTDIDKEAVKTARRYAKKNNLEITFLVQDIRDLEIKCDTVIMNPPFGAQKSNQKADRKFIETGSEIASIVYSIHLAKTIPFITKLISSLGGTVNYSKDYVFPIKWMYEFHEKKIVNYDVTLLRIVTGI